jgi:cephalosporin hydroxylase
MGQPHSLEGMTVAVTVTSNVKLADYWRERARQHTGDQYLGITMSKFPEDLRVYEQLLWMTRANVVIELGTQFGASALWLRDRLRTLASYGLVGTPQVISVDVSAEQAHKEVGRVDPAYAETITLLEGDVRDPAVRAAVGRSLPEEARCLVIEDSAHTEATTRAALELYADLVPPGGFFVVEDGCVDIEWMRIDPDWPRGVLPAVRKWLATDKGSAFRMRRDIEVYGITCHPEGFLQRISPEGS